MSEDTESVVDVGAQKTTRTVAKPEKKSILLIVVLVVAVIAIGLAVWYKFGVDTTVEERVGSIDPDSIVASVNGIEIKRAELDEKIQQVKNTLPEGEGDPSTDAAFEIELLDEVVNLKLLVATAQSKGFTVSEEDIQNEITSLTEAFGGDAEFQKQLTNNGLTIEDLQKNMFNELLIRQLIDSETNIRTVTVTDEEIKKTYDDAIASAPSGQEELPSLTDMTDTIRAQLLQKKSATIVQEYIDTLRAGAKIDILL